MSIRRIISIALFIGGIVLIFYAMHYMQELSEAKGFAQDSENFFKHNPSAWNGLIEFFGGQAQEKIAKYDTQVMVLFISGIILAVGGLVSALIPHKRKK
jgi:hypothetical protein